MQQTRIGADHLVARLLTVPPEERARVLAQESPRAWDSVLFFAVRDGLRDARFGGRLSAADYLETLQQVERHFDQGSENSIPRGPPANEDSDEHTVDLIPEAANDAAGSAQASAPQPDPARETSRPEHSADASPARATPREPVTAPRPTLVAASVSPAVAPPHPRVEFVPGAKIRERYVLEHQIGRGGSAIVFRARDLRREAIVALKVLREELRDVPDKIERLKREFHQAQALSHPNIVRVFDIDCEAGAWFLTMEALDGESLRSHLAALQSKRWPEKEALAIISACADALAFAHEHDQVHGDFKPENVLVTRDRQVRLLDFGVANTAASPRSGAAHAPAATPAYASPEVLGSQLPEPSDDVFSLACVAYELLTGRHPFDRLSAVAARQRGLRLRRLPGLSHRQFAALKRGLAWSRSKRPTSVRALVSELHQPDAAGRAAGFWFSVLAIALGTVITIAFLLSRDREPSGGAEPAVVQGAASPASEPEATSPVTSGAQQSAAAPVAAPSPEQTRVTQPSVVLVPREPARSGAVAPGSTSVVSAVAPPSPPVRSAADAEATTAVIQSQPSSAAGGVTFAQASIVVSERATQAVIRIARHGSLQGRVRVSWRTIPGTAQPGLDYSTIDSGTVSIPEGQDVRVLYIPIVDDAVREPNKSFDVELFALDGPGRQGPITRTRITILDDD